MKDIKSLIERKDAVKWKIERYSSKIKLLSDELKELETALSVLSKYGFVENMDNPIDSSTPPKTIADMALKLLEENPKGLTANEILDNIQRKWMPTLARTSLSPPLSRLKHLGKVKLDGQHWILETKKNYPEDIKDILGVFE